MACSSLNLGNTVVHVWLVAPLVVTDAGLLASYRELLSPDERAQHARFVFAKDRHRYLVTRALVRTTLSRYADIEPSLWRFEKNQYGRPEIAAGLGVDSLRFNVSHTTGLIACLVGLDRDLGVDVEDTQRPGQTIEIADRFFSRAEVEALHALPAAYRPERFFEYWTLKESYIKARGMGLSLPLDQFAFHIAPATETVISCDPRLGDAPRSWQFTQFRPTLRHQAAVAIRRAWDPALSIQCRWTVPLGRSD